MTLENPISGTDYLEAIQNQVKRILASDEFLATQKQRDFFSFVVQETLAGRPDKIKGYRIATEVLGRSTDFDAGTDPIVSIHAQKLRQALERYYLLTGKRDPIHIDIPKGQYVPVFTKKKRTADHSGERADTGWPSVLILPFRNLTGKPENHILGTGFASEIANEITRSREMKVTFRGNDDSPPPLPLSRFLIGGNIYENETGIRVTCYLKDLSRAGAAAITNARLEEMSLVLVEAALGGGDLPLVELSEEAVVVRCEQIEADRWEIGLFFHTMKPETRDAIDYYIDRALTISV